MKHEKVRETEYSHDTTIELQIPRHAVQVHDDHVCLTLPVRPINLDFSSIAAQLEDAMPVREAQRLTDELGEHMHRKLVERILADLVR